MARLLYDTQTATLRPYPRPDDEPVVGLDPRYLSLELIEEPQPPYDQQAERIEPTEVIDLDALTVVRGWAIHPIEPPAPPDPAPDRLGFAGWVDRSGEHTSELQAQNRLAGGGGGGGGGALLVCCPSRSRL